MSEKLDWKPISRLSGLSAKELVQQMREWMLTRGFIPYSPRSGPTDKEVADLMFKVTWQAIGCLEADKLETWKDSVQDLMTEFYLAHKQGQIDVRIEIESEEKEVEPRGKKSKVDIDLVEDDEDQ